jgi:hypothetical protein
LDNHLVGQLAGHVYVRLMLLLALAGLAVAAALVYTGAVAIPPRWNPWAPLDPAESPNWLTRYKLGRLADDPASCLAALERAELRYILLPDRDTAPGCGLRNAVRIEATSAAVEPFPLSCRSAISLALWERHFVQPASVRHFGTPVARVEHFGSYACRNVYGRKDDRRSQHASADAFDVSGFVLADGRRIRILTDWPGDDVEARFLRDVHDGACRVFDAVLGPGYNAAHRDHLHVDRGPFRMCR